MQTTCYTLPSRGVEEGHGTHGKMLAIMARRVYPDNIATVKAHCAVAFVL